MWLFVRDSDGYTEPIFSFIMNHITRRTADTTEDFPWLQREHFLLQLVFFFLYHLMDARRNQSTVLLEGFYSSVCERSCWHLWETRPSCFTAEILTAVSQFNCCVAWRRGKRCTLGMNQSFHPQIHSFPRQFFFLFGGADLAGVEGHYLQFQLINYKLQILLTVS